MRFGFTSLPFIMEEIAKSEARTALAIGITEARAGHAVDDVLTREQRNNLTAGALQDLVMPEEEKGPGPLPHDADAPYVEPVVTPPLHAAELAALEAEMDRANTQHRLANLGLVMGKPPPPRR